MITNLIKDKGLSFAVFLIFAMFVYGMLSYTYYAYSKLNSIDNAYFSRYDSAEYQLKQLDCLAKNIYYEAANEPFEGKVAVAQVTLNRVSDSRFPMSICEVVQQKNIFYEKIVCQFSWYCQYPSKLKVVNKQSFEESERVAKLVLYENFKLPGLDKCFYYHADYVNPGWNKTKVTKIGKHIFYR